MTSLHPTAPAPSLPGPPGENAGASSPPSVPGATVTAVAAVPVCSIAAVGEVGTTGTTGATGTTSATGSAGGVVGPGSACRPDSVPRPRSRDDADASVLPAVAPATDSSPANGDPTAARLRSAFAERLRAARAQGRSVAELAAACRRPVAEVQALLGEATGDGADAPAVLVPDDGREAGAGVGAEAVDGTEVEVGTGTGTGRGVEVGFVRFPSAAAPPEDGPSPSTRRPPREELRPPGSRRPSPSRRLRRMHPRTAPDGQEATARETAATARAGTDLHGTAAWTGELAEATGTMAAQVPFGADTTTAITPGTGTSPAGAPRAEAPHAEPPLGILIGGSPGQPGSVGRPEERVPVRVPAEPIRVGRGTSLVVLPSWRPAIAVSVSTEQLLAATGLSFAQLPGSRLTVLMNPSALHDRELELHGWEPCPAARGRRGGQP
ncbi:hypothetical protein [Kitasatospora sp. NPDC086791]|uniref:hypothetical protein n=1 Tax=Kitasatospora sp. NPDC086791 TaxID=3155178 RepID=UPI00343C97BD